MTDGPAHGPGDDTRIEPDDWIWRRPLPDVVRRMQARRTGSRPRPASAMRILETFAERRSIDDLLQLEPVNGNSGHFDPLDAAAILALAALKRDVRDAAQLTVRRWEIECAAASADPSPPTPLTDSIIHDVTAQRTVKDVADFVLACCGDGRQALIDKIIGAFAGRDSGRSNFDKALLYLALKDRDRPGEASALLSRIVKQAAAPGRDPLPERQGIVAAFAHLSPQDPIVGRLLETWASSISTEDDAIRTAADLLIEDPAGAEPLARRIGREWKPVHLVKICEILSKEQESLYQRVRGYAAERPDTDALYEIIREWHLSAVLSGELMELLAGIVSPGPADRPRAISFLTELRETLDRRNVHAECGVMLQIAVALHVYGRTGAEVAELLGRVRGRGDKRRAAREVNRRLAQGLFAGVIDADTVLDYFTGLQRLPAARALIYSAVRELAEPAPDVAPRTMAAAVAEVAVRLYRTGTLDVQAFDLLERFLENEQFVGATAVVEVSRHVADTAHGTGPADVTSRRMGEDPRWEALLSSTVGRWAEVRRREAAVSMLYDAGLPEDGNAIIN